MKKFLLRFLIICPFIGFGQAKDSTSVLKEVVVYTFEKSRNLVNNPDAVVRVNSKLLNIQSQSSFVNSLNSQAGVRMEERSPGSYRMAIRGSALRSPFGVRNVKIYWNNLPITDAGNNTYLNVLDPAMFNSVDIIKGPTGGIYGSGTGGTILLNTQTMEESSVKLTQYYNSIGGYKQNTDIQFGNNRIFLGVQNQRGFREQSDLSRLFLAYEGNYRLRKTGNLNLLAYSSKLKYQTPGGLTLNQYNSNPRQARPPGGPNKGAVEQKAEFQIQSLFLGANLENKWNSEWSWNWGNVLQINSVTNPTIRNYEERIEPNFSSRGVIHYQTNKVFSFDIGMEYQRGKFNSNTYGNFFGLKDTLQTTLNTRIQQLTFFNQADFVLNQRVDLSLSASLNYLNYEFKSSELIASPRISLVYKVHANHRIVGKVSHGFSPPSIAELRPSTGIFDKNLRAEKGWNKELIYRGNLVNKKINWTVNGYIFNLKETIVLKTGENGADYYINAGASIQKGIEASLSWNNRWQEALISLTIQDFKFKDYQSGGQDFSGKFLPGIPQKSLFITEIFHINPKIDWSFQMQQTGKIYLNDANLVELPASAIYNSRINYHWMIKGKKCVSWIYLDNIFDIKYSLGPDLNAFGGRYYNLAPGRNFSIGLNLEI